MVFILSTTKRGSGPNLRAFQEEAMCFPELSSAVVGREGHIGDLDFLGKSLLGEGSVNTHGEEFNHLK